jgi:hypothetical protein
LSLQPRSLPAAVAGASKEVGLELDRRAEDVEEEAAHGVGGADRSSGIQHDDLRRELVIDVGGVAQRAGETIPFRDTEDVPGTARSESSLSPGRARVVPDEP